MTMSPFRLLLTVAACLCSLCVAAQTFPSRAITMIVGYPPGGNSDIVARVYSQKLSERLGQPVIIDNRPGAAGVMSLRILTKSPNDGYTLAIGDIGNMVVSSYVNTDTGYNAQKDFAPVGLVATTSLLVAVNPKSPINTFQEFLTAAKAQPGKLTFGSGGVGNAGHLAFEQVRSITKIDVLHIPFKGGAQATTALMSEEIDMVIDGSTFAQVKSGRLKALAVTGPRLPGLPDVPSIGETVKGFSFTNWWGFIAPVGTPDEAVNRLNKELNAIAALPEIRERMKDLGLEAKSSTPRQFADHLRSETENVGRIVKDAGIKFQ